MCEGGDQGQEVFLGVLSLPRTPRGTQTTPPSTPPRKEDQGIDTQELEEIIKMGRNQSQAVDTWDLEKGIKGLSVATQTRLEVAGKEERGWALVEVGNGDISTPRDNIPGGWENMWMQDP